PPPPQTQSRSSTYSWHLHAPRPGRVPHAHRRRPNNDPQSGTGLLACRSVGLGEDRPPNLSHLAGGPIMVAPTSRKIGKYGIVRKLGRGGMADVYLAHDTESGGVVALKLIEHATDPDTIAATVAQRRG